MQRSYRWQLTLNDKLSAIEMLAFNDEAPNPTPPPPPQPSPPPPYA